MPQLTTQEREARMAETRQFLQQGGYERLGSVRIAGQGMVDIYQNANWEMTAVRQSDGFRYQSNARINEFYQRFQEQQEGQTPFQAEAARAEQRSITETVFDFAADIARYTVDSVRDTVALARRAAERMETAPAREAPAVQAEAQDAMQLREEAMSTEQIARSNALTAIGAYSISQEYVPGDMRASVPSEPPRVSTADISPRGLYDSGRVTIDVDMRGTQRVVTVFHEENHYVAEHTRGGREVPKLLDEGLTELYAARQAAQFGVNPNPEALSYRTMVQTVRTIEAITGEPEMRRAYYSGDFSRVERAVDERLGAGTFRQISEYGSRDTVVAPDAVYSGADYAFAVLATSMNRAGLTA